MNLASTCIIWTRSTVLILSVVIVILSLSIYNSNAIPVFTLLESDRSSLLARGHGIIYDMIQDRRLIATLVAAQASILCPLFLLLGAPSTHHSPIDIEEDHQHCRWNRVDIWKTLIEQLCQFLMPLGLALSWLFCILFDRKTEMALRNQNMNVYMLDHGNERHGMMALYTVTVLKYLVVVMLLIEVVAIWCSTLIRNTSHIKKGGIQLNEEDEEYTVYVKNDVENA